ncbi:MAG: peptidyl-prolyl cis-trans isomerase A (cyclophilin A) [Enterobacterales bacterium]|jgi:peptidyl-prolyl cis-trans isomerase A (cyclophilin A)
MNQFKKRKSLFLAITLYCFAILSGFSIQATIVKFETNMGDFSVNLYDVATPVTVANFLEYLNNGDYANSVFHRSVTDFVIQGGGFAYNANWPLDNVFANNPVINEPVYSNVRGSIAMAKIGIDVGNVNSEDSATNQWFINLGNNSQNLDIQNGGFTVFGEVIADDMTIIDAIAALQQYNLSVVFDSIPLRNYDDSNDPNDTNLVIITNIIVTDDTVDSAADLSPAANIVPVFLPVPIETSSGGGSLGMLMMGLFLLISRKLILAKNNNNL